MRNTFRYFAILPVLAILALVTAGPEVGAAVETNGVIAGRVLAAGSGTPIPLVEVMILDERGEASATVLTGIDGTFVVKDLTAGRYFAATLDSGFVDEIWEDNPCPDDCGPTDGKPIQVEAGIVTQGVDFVLSRH